MNERIEELFKRAGGKTSIHNLMSNPMQQREYRELWNENIDKFALLIVKECVNNLEIHSTCFDGDVGRGIKTAARLTKEHFGVE